MTFSKYSPASPRAIHMLRVIVLLALLMSNLAPLAAPSPIAAADLAGTSQPSQAPAPAATNVSATKTDSLLGDADGDGRADPGDTLRYTVAVSNTGTTDASNMVISDTLDPNTSLVAGSVRVSPLALGDTYSALQNTPLVIAAPGLLANDTGTPAPAVTPVTSVATTAGGSVTIASDGSFTYTPPANYTGADSFTYTAGNSAGSDTGAVSITAEGAPLVSSTTPASNAADVPANSNITITFSEPVNVTASAFTLACPVAQPFTVSPPSPATTFTLDPVDTLPVSATCTLTVVAANVSDADTLDPPDQMTADYSFSFTTTDAAPSVTSITPADGAANVAIDSSITVDFSESVNASASSFTLTCGASTQTFALSAAPASSFTLDPISDLPAGANCTVVVLASEIADVDAIDPPDQMAANYSFSFSTDAAPIVASTTPANGATSVAADANIVVDFSESVNAAASTFDLACGGIAQPFSLSASPASSFTLDPTADLPTGASCTVTVVAANVSDVDAADPPDQMAADYSFSFSTDAAPTVTSTTPANGATDLAANTTVVVNFSESVNATTSSFTLTCGGPALSYSLSASPASSFTLTPAAILPAGASCDVTVVAANITDADGIDPPDQMAANYSFSFSTDAAPTVISTSPIDGATGVATNATITVNFSESVNATADSFSFDCGASAQPFTLSPAPAVSFTLDPDSDLPEGTSCIVIVLANQIADADTADPPDQMAADYTFSFTTDPAPSVTSTTPANGAINVALGSNITVNFSESVNATSSSFTLTCGGPSLPFTLSASPASSFTLDPASSFPVNTLCTVTVVAAQVGDVDASDPPDTLAADYVFSFTSIDDTAPNVSSTTPANAATGSAIDTDITINFSEPANLTGSAFTIECPTGTPIAF
ncbi:MAG TPA: Ig-like domain-containing protein, partial [Roseiflexaceae bacterium]|nr:Ig-like domain-containing protein [Roseiflexaceae bacterium]